MRFKDKSVIVTGGGGKIAKAYAMAFAKEGAKLSLPDIASADGIVKAIKDMGGTAISMACDVSNEQSVKAMVEEAVVPHMQKQKSGKIINISSNVALTGNPNYIHYVTSKGALIAMTRAMARELGDYNICVNTVSPGFVVTEGRQVDPAYEKVRAQQRSINRSQVETDLVGTVLFLSSPASDFMTGQLLNVGGG